MTKTLNKIFLILPHSFLAVIFFLLHDVNENFGLIPFDLFIKYFSLYLVVCLLLLAISFYLFKERTKAFIYATLVLSMFFSFGAGQDKLKSLSLPAWVSSYTVLLSGNILLFLVTGYFLRRPNKDFSRFNQYLQLFFSVITGMELVVWCFYSINHYELKNEFGDRSKKLSKQYQPCDTCSKPDIYFIVFDAYSSSKCLKRNFGFDNSAIDSFLDKEGFFVSKDSRSNYALTPLSIASTFNLNYLRPDMKVKEVDGKLIVQSLSTLYSSELPVLLEKEGYDIRNYSIFNLKNYPVYSSEQHARFRDNLIHLQTFAGRVNRDIGWKIITYLPFWTTAKANAEFESSRKTSIQRYIMGNLQKLEAAIKEKNGGPKFVYAHLVIPHDPYYYDEKGHLNPDSMIHSVRPELYLKQLVYTNSLIRRIVDDLKSDTTRKKIVIIEGDHGFREYHNPSKLPEIFCNLNAYYFPDKDYHMLYDSISPVNSFRVILDKYFHKNLSLLPDRSVYIKAPYLSFEQTKH